MAVWYACAFYSIVRTLYIPFAYYLIHYFNTMHRVCNICTTENENGIYFYLCIVRDQQLYIIFLFSIVHMHMHSTYIAFYSTISQPDSSTWDFCRILYMYVRAVYALNWRVDMCARVRVYDVWCEWSKKM